MDRDAFDRLLRKPVAFTAALADDDLIALYAAMRDAMADPAWPRNDPATDRRITDAIAAALDRRGFLGEAELFYVANHAEAVAMVAAERRRI